MKKDYLLVGIQFVLFLLYIFNFEFIELKIDYWLRKVGLVIGLIGASVIVLAILQLNKNLSPFPTPKIDGELITNGLYGFVRHPIYTGILLGSIGYGVFSESIWKLAVALALLILFHFKATYEEKLLSEKFLRYRQYMTYAGRFLPKFKK